MAKVPGDRFNFQPPQLPALFGAPWEQQVDPKAAAEIAYSQRAQAARERMSQERIRNAIQDADKALTAAHRAAGDIAASFPAPSQSTNRTKWVAYTNKIAHIRDEMRRMLGEVPGA